LRHRLALPSPARRQRQEAQRMVCYSFPTNDTLVFFSFNFNKLLGFDCSGGRIVLVATTATTRHSSGFAGQFFLHLRFQNWARILVRSRLFCKEKTVIFRDATAGDFELRKPLFLPISEFRGAVGMLRLRLHREARATARITR